LEVCLRALRRFGYQASGVDSGAKAIESFQATPCDLVLSDIKMPDVDGLEVLRRVKQIRSDIPVVLITGFGTLDTAIHAVELGAEGFLLKPFHAEDLHRAVEDALAKTRLWRENVRLKTLLPLLEATQALVGESELARLHQTIVAKAISLTNADSAWLFLQDAQDFARLAAHAGEGSESFPALAQTILSETSDDSAPWLLSREIDEQPAKRLGQALQLFDLIRLPLALHDQRIGFLLVGRTHGHIPFEDGDVETLKLFERQAAAALENALLFEQLRDYAERLEEMVDERTAALRESEAHVRQLYEASRRLRNSLDFKMVVSDVLALAISIAGAQYGVLVAFDRAGQVRERLQRGDPIQGVTDCREPEGRLLEQTLVAKEPLIHTGRGAADGAVVPGCSALSLPIISEGQVLAALILLHPSTDHFAPTHTELLLPICSQAAAVLANVRLFEETSFRLDRAYVEIQERAKQLEMTTQQLVRAEKLALIGQLAAGISHELGNVIAPLQVYADLLGNFGPGDVEYTKYLEQIQAITERARNILRQFTDFARKDNAQRTDVSLQEIAERSISLLDFFLRRKMITVRRNYAADLPCVYADPGQLEQVFTNIIVNAMDAMSQNGALEVTTRAAYSAPGEAQYAEILFADNGCGISPENLERMFEPFFTTKEVGKGTGLGLFICYGIIEKHNGTIDIESKLGKGATLRIRLPLSAPQSKTA
jgi:signal transduction histidine kinase/CheY-like chemotaxis protein